MRSIVAQGRSLTHPTGVTPAVHRQRLPKQDDKTLRDIQEYIDQLLAERERRREEPVTEDDLPNDVDVVEFSGHYWVMRKGKYTFDAYDHPV